MLLLKNIALSEGERVMDKKTKENHILHASFICLLLINIINLSRVILSGKFNEPSTIILFLALESNFLFLSSLRKFNKTNNALNTFSILNTLLVLVYMFLIMPN